MSKGQFQCRHCGDRFDDKDSADLVYEGYISSSDVDTCPDCCGMINHPSENYEGSDADPGL